MCFLLRSSERKSSPFPKQCEPFVRGARATHDWPSKASPSGQSVRYRHLASTDARCSLVIDCACIRSGLIATSVRGACGACASRCARDSNKKRRRFADVYTNRKKLTVMVRTVSVFMLILSTVRITLHTDRQVSWLSFVARGAFPEQLLQ